METNKQSLAAAVTTALACAAALALLIAPTTHGVAQTNPTMTNVVPDGGEFAAKGKIQALDPGAGTLTLVPESSRRFP